MAFFEIKTTVSVFKKYIPLIIIIFILMFFLFAVPILVYLLAIGSLGGLFFSSLGWLYSVEQIVKNIPGLNCMASWATSLALGLFGIGVSLDNSTVEDMINREFKAKSSSFVEVIKKYDVLAEKVEKTFKYKGNWVYIYSLLKTVESEFNEKNIEEASMLFQNINDKLNDEKIYNYIASKKVINLTNLSEFEIESIKLSILSAYRNSVFNTKVLISNFVGDYGVEDGYGVIPFFVLEKGTVYSFGKSLTNKEMDGIIENLKDNNFKDVNINYMRVIEENIDTIIKEVEGREYNKYKKETKDELNRIDADIERVLKDNSDDKALKILEDELYKEVTMESDKKAYESLARINTEIEKIILDIDIAKDNKDKNKVEILNCELQKKYKTRENILQIEKAKKNLDAEKIQKRNEILKIYNKKLKDLTDKKNKIINQNKNEYSALLDNLERIRKKVIMNSIKGEYQPAAVKIEVKEGTPIISPENCSLVGIGLSNKDGKGMLAELISDDGKRKYVFTNMGDYCRELKVFKNSYITVMDPNDETHINTGVEPYLKPRKGDIIGYAGRTNFFGIEIYSINESGNAIEDFGVETKEGIKYNMFRGEIEAKTTVPIWEKTEQMLLLKLMERKTKKL